MNRSRKSVSSILLGLLFSFALGIPSAFAVVVVDNSPDTTGVPRSGNFTNNTSIQYLGDRFTLAQATTITGGAIFGPVFIATSAVGFPVRFVILPDDGGVPGAVPVLDVLSVLDAEDDTLTTSDPTMSRKHATIPQQSLPAGDYWFYMAGDGFSLGQGTGIYDDDSFFVGFDSNPDLEGGAFTGFGDVFFTIEGVDDAPRQSIPVPTLNTWYVLVFLAMVIGLFGFRALRRR